MCSKSVTATILSLVVSSIVLCREGPAQLSNETLTCFQNHPYPCTLNLTAYPWSDEKLAEFQGDVTIPASFPTADRQRYKDFLGQIKLMKLIAINATCQEGGHNAVILRNMRSKYLVPLGPNPEYTVVKITIRDVPVTIYTPTRAHVGLRAGVFFIHGGGWVIGSSDEMETFISKLVIGGDFVVFSVDYRLAPEHVFPAAFDDCEKTARYFLSNSAAYGVDENRVAIMGDSSGGNLAAAVTLKLRDINSEHRFRLQVLVYPALQALDFNTPSYQRNACDAILDRPWMIEFWMWYALGSFHSDWLPLLVRNGHTPSSIKQQYASLVNTSGLADNFVNFDDITMDGSDTLWQAVKNPFRNPYFAPLMSGDLNDLPPAYIMLTTQDVLYDDGAMYADRLLAEGNVSVRVAIHEALHGFIGDPSMDLVATAISDTIDYMKAELSPDMCSSTVRNILSRSIIVAVFLSMILTLCNTII